jgi:hypothetical protein
VGVEDRCQGDERGREMTMGTGTGMWSVSGGQVSVGHRAVLGGGKVVSSEGGGRR